MTLLLKVCLFPTGIPQSNRPHNVCTFATYGHETQLKLSSLTLKNALKFFPFSLLELNGPLLKSATLHYSRRVWCNSNCSFSPHFFTCSATAHAIQLGDHENILGLFASHAMPCGPPPGQVDSTNALLLGASRPFPQYGVLRGGGLVLLLILSFHSPFYYANGLVVRRH